MMRTLVALPPLRQAAPNAVCDAPSWRRRLLLALLGLMLVTSGCEEKRRPWSSTPDASVVVEPTAFLPPPPPVPENSTTPSGSSRADASDRDAGTSSRQSLPSRVGGLWVSCYGGFQPSSDPLADATRLGMLCGPPSGMRQHGIAFEGKLEAGKPAVLALPVELGSCYRVFAVADAAIDDLDVVVRSPRGSVLARDDSHDRWPIVEPERPFCSFEDARFNIELSARQPGRYAATVWRLPPAKSSVSSDSR